MKIRYLTLCFPIALLYIIAIGCKKIVNVSSPITSITGASVFNSDATAIATLTGIYTNLSSANPTTAGGISSLSLYAGMSADELTLWSGNKNLTVLAYYRNALLASSTTTSYGAEYWNKLYGYVFSCNAAIEGLNASSGLTPAVKQQILGEAKFLRAFFYYFLVNLYGDVPLPLATDYTKNELLARSSSSQVYQQIVADLHDAQKLLNPGYVDATMMNTTTDRVRPTSWAATALLARAYLYSGNWDGADSAASALINNTGQFGLSNIDSAFLRSSLKNNEAIWQLQPVINTPVTNTQDARAFIIASTGLGAAGNFGVYLSSNLLNSFEVGDKRMSRWTGKITLSGVTYYYPYKYKVNATGSTTPVTEHLMILRLGEQYLIRAEARANEGNLGGAQSDLNAIRARAGLTATTASTQSGILSAIQHERQVELFTELGQRWLDLKRTNAIDAAMSVATVQKGGSWMSYQQWYPLPVSDLQLDLNLKQNNGY